MSEPTVIIERVNTAARNLPVPVIGRTGLLGNAMWDDKRAAHVLRLPLSVFRPERRAIVENLGRFDRIAFDFEGGESEAIHPDAPTDLEMILVEYQLDGETAERALLRIISHLHRLQAWTPTQGRKPTLELPKPCSPRAS